LGEEGNNSKKNFEQINKEIEKNFRIDWLWKSSREIKRGYLL